MPKNCLDPTSGTRQGVSKMDRTAALREISAEVDAVTKQVEGMIGRCVILDDELLSWAQYRAKSLGKESVSQYVFDLIREDKKKVGDRRGCA